MEVIYWGLGLGTEVWYEGGWERDRRLGAGRRIDNQRRRLKRCITISERV